jgi:hypothetical protein
MVPVTTISTICIPNPKRFQKPPYQPLYTRSIRRSSTVIPSAGAIPVTGMAAMNSITVKSRTRMYASGKKRLIRATLPSTSVSNNFFNFFTSKLFFHCFISRAATNMGQLFWI